MHGVNVKLSLQGDPDTAELEEKCFLREFHVVEVLDCDLMLHFM